MKKILRAISDRGWMSRIVLIAILSCLMMLGCTAAKPNDVIGTWVLTDQARQRFLPLAQQKAAAEIVLHADGTFVASEIPEDLLYGPPESADRLVTGSGVWKLISQGGTQRIQLEFRAIAAGQRGSVPYGTMLGVSKGWSATTLFYFQGGDADQGRRIEFAKKSSSD